MFGNVLNDATIKKLKDDGVISITPFDESLLKTIYYPVHVGYIKEIQDDGSWKTVHSLVDGQDKPFKLGPLKSVQIAIKELIQLPEGIIGEFILASNTINQGISLDVGHIGNPFGQKGETMHMLVFNRLEREVLIKPNQKVAYVRFIDLRNLRNYSVKELTEEEKEIYKNRQMYKKFREMQEDGGGVWDKRSVILPDELNNDEGL